MGVSEPVTLLQTVDGSWSLWTSWSSCSKTCLSKLDGFGKNKKIMKIKHFIVLFAATGSQTRTRRCDSPKPQNVGKQCLGQETETIHCINRLKGFTLCQSVSYDNLDSFCEGQWQKWTPWSSCSKSCKEGGSPAGVRNRKRKCFELSCEDGGNVETEDCNTHNCPREYLRLGC